MKKSPQNKNWYSNRYQIIVAQRNILLLFTVVAILSLAILSIFVNKVISSKSLEPYIVEIAEKTGIPTVVEQSSVEEYSANEALIKYFVNKFIHAIHGYNPNTYTNDFQTVRVLSVPEVFSQYVSRIKASQLRDKIVEVNIKSITATGKNKMEVRVQVVTKNTKSLTGNENIEKTENQTIKLEYIFANLNLSKKDRNINPLGFQVTKYLIHDELY